MSVLTITPSRLILNTRTLEISRYENIPSDIRIECSSKPEDLDYIDVTGDLEYEMAHARIIEHELPESGELM